MGAPCRARVQHVSIYLFLIGKFFGPSFLTILFEQATTGGTKSPYLIILPQMPDMSGGWRPQGPSSALRQLQGKQQQDGKRSDYIQLIDLQKAERRVAFLGKRHCHRLADSLQATTSLSMFGGSFRKTTSCLCFHSSQQQRRIQVGATFSGVPGGVFVSHNLSTG